MTGLRGLVEKADAGPWWYDGRDIFHKRPGTNLDQIIVPIPDKHETFHLLGAVKDETARLCALAPDLALWAADAADALQNWKGQNHGFTRRGKPRRGCNLKTIHGCQPCRLLARFAVIQARAQEEQT